MKRTCLVLCFTLIATAAFAAGETIELPDGTTMDVLYPGVDGVSRPIAKKNDRVVPEYPPLASPLKEESAVVFAVLVGADGRPVQAVVRMATHPGIGFEDAAAEALLRWEFEPATLDGKPVASYTNIRVRFPDRPPSSRSGLVGGLPSGAAGGGSGMVDRSTGVLWASGGADDARFGGGSEKGARAEGQQARPSATSTPGQGLTRAKVPQVSQGQIYFRGHPEWGYRLYNGTPGEGSTEPRSR